MMPRDVFLDTAFAIALANPHDLLHTRANTIADELELARTRLVTTTAVLLEIGNALSKAANRRASVQLLTALEIDPRVLIIPLSDDLYQRALQLYQDRPDKEWGLTDCVSFVVMQDHGLTSALTSDRHFQQAGYQVLLRD